MAVRFPKVTYITAEEAARDIAGIVSGVLADEEKPYRYENIPCNVIPVSVTPGPGPGPGKNIEFDPAEMAYRITNSLSVIGGEAIQIPHVAHLRECTLNPHISLYSLTAGSTTGSCKSIWRFRWKWYNETGTHSASWNTKTVTATNTSDARQSFIIEFGDITASLTLAVSSIFKFEICKLPAGGNRVYYVDVTNVHFRVDLDRGSSGEWVKWLENQ